MRYVLHRAANPDDLFTLISLLKENSGLSRNEIINLAESQGYLIKDKKHPEMFAFAKDLGLIDKKENRLTDKGVDLYTIINNKPHIFWDIVHALQVTLWTKNDPSTAFSWTYREVCKLIWSSSIKEDLNNSSIVRNIESHAKVEFGQETALSSKSILGVRHWLEKLSPAVLFEEKGKWFFSYRNFCAPELFLLCLYYLYTNRDLGSNLLINPHVQEEVCWMCLIAPGSFDNVLDYTKMQFDYLESSVGGGWGRYIVFHEVPKLRDFI